MTNTAIFYPMLVQVFLTLGLLMWLGIARVGAATRGVVRTKDIALDSSAWPERIRKIGNCVSNQYELPVLFFLLCVLLLTTFGLNTLQVILAWAFVASRFVHAYIHTGINNPIHRFYAFLFGTAVLTVMWVNFAFAVIAKSL